MRRPIVIVGAGGFGREVVDVIEAINIAELNRAAEPPWELMGVVDDSITADNLERLQRRSIEHLGGTQEFLASTQGTVSYAVGIGAPAVRRRIAETFDASGHEGAVLVHPAASIGSMVNLGRGSVVCAGARITTNVTIGRHVHINLNATIGHDTGIDDYVSLNPLASISGDCTIESEVLVGVGGILLNGLRVGRGGIIGGAACAVRDVEPGTTVIGVPARPR